MIDQINDNSKNEKQKIERKVVAIHTPSTYISENYKPSSNFICAIFFEEIIQKNGSIIIFIGMSAIDVSTGEVYIHETKTFDDDVENIINEHTYDLNADTELGIKEYLERDYSDMFAQYGLPMTGTFYRKTVKLNDLMKTYQKYNPKFNIGIYSLLRRIINLENIDPPRIADNVYEFGTGDYEYSSTKNAIEKLLDTMEETINENENLSGDYVEHYDFIKKLGGFDKWVSMPGDKRYMLKITDLDMEDDRVTFALQNIVKDDSKKMRLPFEKFKDFIYNLQLF